MGIVHIRCVVDRKLYGLDWPDRWGAIVLGQRWCSSLRSSWAGAGIGPSEKVAGREKRNTRGPA